MCKSTNELSRLSQDQLAKEIHDLKLKLMWINQQRKLKLHPKFKRTLDSEYNTTNELLNYAVTKAA